MIFLLKLGKRESRRQQDLKRLLQTVGRCRDGLCTPNGEIVLERLIFEKKREQTCEKN